MSTLCPRLIGRTQPRQVGVTMTEVVVASALLIVAMVPILKALTIAQVTGNAIERKTRSLMLAQGKLDEIKARSIYHYTDSFAERFSPALYLSGHSTKKPARLKI